MMQIILTQTQQDKLLGIRQGVISILKKKEIDIDPVKILSGEYILPAEILSDSRYVEFHTFLVTLPQRDIVQSDLIISSL